MSGLVRLQALKLLYIVYFSTLVVNSANMAMHNTSCYHTHSDSNTCYFIDGPGSFLKDTCVTYLTLPQQLNKILSCFMHWVLLGYLNQFSNDFLQYDCLVI